MKESERIEFIRNAVANATKKVAPEFKDLVAELKAEKMAEDFVLENGLLPVSDDEVKEEFVSLDAVEADKDDIDENDEEQTDMDCVSGSFADIFDKIEDWINGFTNLDDRRTLENLRIALCCVYCLAWFISLTFN